MKKLDTGLKKLSLEKFKIAEFKKTNLVFGGRGNNNLTGFDEKDDNKTITLPTSRL